MFDQLYWSSSTGQSCGRGGPRLDQAITLTVCQRCYSLSHKILAEEPKHRIISLFRKSRSQQAWLTATSELIQLEFVWRGSRRERTWCHMDRGPGAGAVAGPGKDTPATLITLPRPGPHRTRSDPTIQPTVHTAPLAGCSPIH